MFVGPTPSSNPHGPHRPRFDEARSARSGSGPGAASAQSASAKGSTTASTVSKAVVQLLDQLRTLPEVRSDRVSEVGAKLERGAYLTREAAEQTAAALVENRRN